MNRYRIPGLMISLGALAALLHEDTVMTAMRIIGWSAMILGVASVVYYALSKDPIEP